VICERGFTLLELLVVLAILGLLIGLVAPAALRQLESSKEKIAHQSIERIAGVLDIYKLDVGVYPTTEQGLLALIARPSGVTRWNGPYLKGENVPQDPWGPLFTTTTRSAPGMNTFVFHGRRAARYARAAIFNE
jgi:general secretion pathway protein G